MNKVVMATVLSLAINAGLSTSAYAIGVTETVTAATLLPTETVSALTFGVNKEVILEAKKRAKAYGQLKQADPFLQAVVNEIRQNNFNASVKFTDEQIINSIAGFEE
ncbi:MAG: hypothetical protein ACXVCP_19700 [Bdellovibrio sp.]